MWFDLICVGVLGATLLAWVPGGVVKPACALLGAILGYAVAGPVVLAVLGGIFWPSTSTSTSTPTLTTAASSSASPIPSSTAAAAVEAAGRAAADGILPVISGLSLGMALVLGAWLGLKVGGLVAPLVNVVPGLNLLNLGVGSVIGVGLGLVIIAALASILTLVAPDFAQVALANSFVAEHIAFPVGKFALSFAPQPVRVALG